MDQLALDVAHLFAGGLVLVSFMLLYQDRLTGIVNNFALHALVVSLSVAWQAYIQRICTSPLRSPSSSRRS
jgi:hydrogenase-4 component E